MNTTTPPDAGPGYLLLTPEPRNDSGTPYHRVPGLLQGGEEYFGTPENIWHPSGLQVGEPFAPALYYRRKVVPEPGYRILEEHEEPSNCDKVYAKENDGVCGPGWIPWHGDTGETAGQLVRVHKNRAAFARKIVPSPATNDNAPAWKVAQDLAKERDEIRNERDNLREVLMDAGEYFDSLNMPADFAKIPHQIHGLALQNIRIKGELDAQKALGLKILKERDSLLLDKKRQIEFSDSWLKDPDSVCCGSRTEWNEWMKGWNLLKIENIQLGQQVQGIAAEHDKWKAKFEQLADDALPALAGAVATPEEGYKNAPHCLSVDIGKLRAERDKLEGENVARFHAMTDLMNDRGRQSKIIGDLREANDGLKEETVRLKRENEAIAAERDTLEGREAQYAAKLYPALGERDQIYCWGDRVTVGVGIACLVKERNQVKDSLDNWKAVAAGAIAGRAAVQKEVAALGDILPHYEETMTLAERATAAVSKIGDLKKELKRVHREIDRMYQRDESGRALVKAYYGTKHNTEVLK